VNQNAVLFSCCNIHGGGGEHHNQCILSFLKLSVFCMSVVMHKGFPSSHFCVQLQVKLSYV
jgi:hypothetical protein